MNFGSLKTQSIIPKRITGRRKKNSSASALPATPCIPTITNQMAKQLDWKDGCAAGGRDLINWMPVFTGMT
jgi:hypothetical protein